MWLLEEYGSLRRSQSSHLSQFGSLNWQLPCWSSWGDSLTERGEKDKQSNLPLPQVLVHVMRVQTEEITGLLL